MLAELRVGISACLRPPKGSAMCEGCCHRVLPQGQGRQHTTARMHCGGLCGWQECTALWQHESV